MSFNVGDFVRHVSDPMSYGVVIGFDGTSVYPKKRSTDVYWGDKFCIKDFDGHRIGLHSQDMLISWYPAHSDWCIFYNDASVNKFILAKFDRIDAGNFITQQGDIFKFCQPFIGFIPAV